MLRYYKYCRSRRVGHHYGDLGLKYTHYCSTYERGQRIIDFPCSADHVQDWQPYPVDPYSCYMRDHTCVVLRKKYTMDVDYVCMVITYYITASVRINRARLPILLVVS